MAFGNLHVRHIEGEALPSITLYFADVQSRDSMKASLPSSITDAIDGISAKQNNRPYLAFPLGSSPTQDVLKAIEQNMPLEAPLSESFKTKITAIADKSNSPENEKVDLQQANEIFFVDMLPYRQPAAVEELAENSKQWMQQLIANGGVDDLSNPKPGTSLAKDEREVELLKAAVKHDLDGNASMLTLPELKAFNLASASLSNSPNHTEEDLARRAGIAFQDYFKNSDITYEQGHSCNATELEAPLAVQVITDPSIKRPPRERC